MTLLLFNHLLVYARENPRWWYARFREDNITVRAGLVLISLLGVNQHLVGFSCQPIADSTVEYSAVKHSTENKQPLLVCCGMTEKPIQIDLYSACVDSKVLTFYLPAPPLVLYFEICSKCTLNR